MGEAFYGPASQNSRRAIWRLFGSCLYGADPNDCHKLPCVDGAGAFAIVALLNEEHVLSSLAVLIKKVAQMKKKKDKPPKREHAE